MQNVMTLCLVHKHPKILLAMKKRDFGVGLWNGYGGKLYEGESLRRAIKREVKEEIGIEPIEWEKRGIMVFEFKKDKKRFEVHVFHITKYKGRPAESEEMKPKWFHVNDIPYKDMWSDDKHWMPLFLAGKKFQGKFLLDKPSDGKYKSKILKKKLIEVDEL
jgi:ADP-ribose pyrophosphatase YjhB (NUDIX family)